jgi:hypothetical protein
MGKLVKHEPGAEAGVSADLAGAERSLKQAQHVMSHGRPSDDAEEWLLLATLIGEADSDFRTARQHNPSLTFPLLEIVVEELYEMTAGFTDPVFLRMTRAARRRNRALFG